ncbi:MAG: flagellar motor switch protein FliM [Fidelibacterota bacterium]|nr:MAG: flagellar motor switch protein FliM [Candidatus Neomarinimicrobiota bacterium]
MAKILSQAEIDALLSTVAEDTSEAARVEGGPPRRVVLYDFKHPNLISKEQMRLLENLHENFSRNFGVFLSAQLRMIVEIELLAIDQLLYSEFVMSIAPPGVLYVFEVEEPPGEAIVELSPGLVIFIVEKLFGGKGSFSAGAARPISAIEQKIMRRVMDRAMQELINVWSPVAAIKVEINRYESNPEFIQIVPSAEPVVVVSLQVKIHDHKTLMNFCYPYRWLSEIVGRPDVQDALQFGVTDSSSEERIMVEDHVRKVTTPVRATLGNTTITIQDFINLQVGDLLVLKERPEETSVMFIKDKPMFKGVVGRRDKFRAFMITDLVGEETSHEV